MVEGSPGRALDDEREAVDGAAAPAGQQEKEPTRLERAQAKYELVSDVLTPSRILVLVGLIAVLIVGLVGGWDSVAEVDEALPTATPSAVTNAAPFELTVKRARHGLELPPVALARDGQRYLFVTVDVTNTADQPVPASVLADAVTIDAEGLPMAGEEPLAPTVFRVNDGLPAKALQPGVATPTVLVWAQDAAAALPDEVAITLHSHTWRASAATGGEGWMDTTALAALTVPLEPLGEAS